METDYVIAPPTRSSLVLHGIANIILGLIAYTWPGLTLYVIAIVLAIDLMAVGVIELFRPLFEKHTPHAVLSIILGILGIVAGFFLLSRPTITAGIISLLIAFWALLFGIADLYLGFGNSGASAGYRILFIIVGLFSVIFGFYLLLYPITAVKDFIWVLGIYGIVSGILYLIGSFFIPPASKSKKK